MGAEVDTHDGAKDKLQHMNHTVDQIAHALCCADFVDSLHEATAAAGGGLNWEVAKCMTLEEAMTLWAPNGIRFEYADHGRVDKKFDAADWYSRAHAFLPPSAPTSA